MLDIHEIDAAGGTGAVPDIVVRYERTGQGRRCERFLAIMFMQEDTVIAAIHDDVARYGGIPHGQCRVIPGIEFVYCVYPEAGAIPYNIVEYGQFTNRNVGVGFGVQPRIVDIDAVVAPVNVVVLYPYVAQDQYLVGVVTITEVIKVNVYGVIGEIAEIVARYNDAIHGDRGRIVTCVDLVDGNVQPMSAVREGVIVHKDRSDVHCGIVMIIITHVIEVKQYSFSVRIKGIARNGICRQSRI